MNVSNFPASATGALIEGYCTDFADMEFMLTETLEQISARGINIEKSIENLEAIESGMLRVAALIRAAIELRDGQPAVADQQVTEQQVTGQQGDATQAPKQQEEPKKNDAESSLASKLQRNAPPLPEPAAPAPKPEPPKPAPGPIRAADGSADQQGEVSLCGNNISMPIASVFQFLENAKKRGLLTVQLPGETLTFGFSEGLVQVCDSSNRDMGDRLGDILAQSQCRDTVRLIELIEAAAYDGSPELGELLVQEGLASNGQIMDALEEQVRRRYRRACESGQATYEFVDQEIPATDGRIRLSPTELAFESQL